MDKTTVHLPAELQRALREAAKAHGVSEAALIREGMSLVTRDDPGIATEMALLDEVARGAYQLQTMNADDVGRARALADRHRDAELGLADASIVVLAAGHGVWDVLTLDERRFRMLRGPRGQSFTILPAPV